MNIRSSRSTVAVTAYPDGTVRNTGIPASSPRRPARRRLGAAIALVLSAATPLPLLAAAAAPTLPAGVAKVLESVGPGAAVSARNYKSFLPSLYSVANARPLEAIHRPVRRTMAGLAAALDGSGGARFVAQSSSGTSTRFACPEGGVVDSSARSSPYSTSLTTSALFRDCRVDGQRLNGFVNWSQDPRNGSESSVFGAPSETAATVPFSYTDATGLVARIAGERRDTPTNEVGYGSLFWAGDWSLRSGAKRLTVKDMLMEASNFNGVIGYTSGFDLAGDLTNGKRVSVATYEPFTTEGGPDFVDGYLQVLQLRDGTSADGLMAISARADGGAGFDVKLDTYSPGPASTLNARISQKLGGGPLRRAAR